MLNRRFRAVAAALTLGGVIALVAVVIVPVALGKSGSTGPSCMAARWGSFTPGSGHSAHGKYSHGTLVTITLTKGANDVDEVMFQDGVGGKITSNFKTYANTNMIVAEVPDGSYTGAIFLYDSLNNCYNPSPRLFRVIQSS